MLNEKLLGSISSILIPQFAQAKLWENFIFSESMTSTSIMPFASLRAVSAESVSLFSRPSLITSLSTTISMLCFLFLSSFISSFNSYWIPSTITLTKPDFLADSNTFWCSPFLPATTGARIWILVLSGRDMISSTIWSTVCFSTFRPHFGQCGIPILA